jgi:hypothetical protein
MDIQQDQIKKGLTELEQLAIGEYGMPLEAILADEERDEYDRLWRVGRLMGIVLKEPFAESESLKDPSLSATGASRAWILDEKSFDLSEKQRTWQYKVLTAVATDGDLKNQVYLGPQASEIASWIIEDFSGPGSYKDSKALTSMLQGNFGSDVDKANKVAQQILEDYRTAGNYLKPETLTQLLQEQFSTEIVRTAAQEMQSERGFFRCLAISAHKYLCKSEKFRKELRESLEQSGGSGIFSSPQALIGAGSVVLANALIDAVPWLLVAHQPLIVGFLILIGSVTLDGFCLWVTDYILPKEVPDVES